MSLEFTIKNTLNIKEGIKRKHFYLEKDEKIETHHLTENEDYESTLILSSDFEKEEENTNTITTTTTSHLCLPLLPLSTSSHPINTSTAITTTSNVSPLRSPNKRLKKEENNQIIKVIPITMTTTTTSSTIPIFSSSSKNTTTTTTAHHHQQVILPILEKSLKNRSIKENKNSDIKDTNKIIITESNDVKTITNLEKETHCKADKRQKEKEEKEEENKVVSSNSEYSYFIPPYPDTDADADGEASDEEEKNEDNNKYKIIKKSMSTSTSTPTTTTKTLLSSTIQPVTSSSKNTPNISNGPSSKSYKFKTHEFKWSKMIPSSATMKPTFPMATRNKSPSTKLLNTVMFPWHQKKINRMNRLNSINAQFDAYYTFTPSTKKLNNSNSNSNHTLSSSHQEEKITSISTSSTIEKKKRIKKSVHFDLRNLVTSSTSSSSNSDTPSSHSTPSTNYKKKDSLTDHYENDTTYELTTDDDRCCLHSIPHSDNSLHMPSYYFTSRSQETKKWDNFLGNESPISETETETETEVEKDKEK